MTGPDSEARAVELGRRFDASFAHPRALISPDFEDILRIRVGADAWALRLRDVSALVARRTIVPVPSPAAGLLGLAGVGGDIVPVFGLTALLGGEADPEPPAWLVLSTGPHRVAFGFTAFEGLLRAPKASLHAADGAGPARRYGAELIITEEGARAIVALPLLVETLLNRLGPNGPRPKEQ